MDPSTRKHCTLSLTLESCVICTWYQPFDEICIFQKILWYIEWWGEVEIKYNVHWRLSNLYLIFDSRSNMLLVLSVNHERWGKISSKCILWNNFKIYDFYGCWNCNYLVPISPKVHMIRMVSFNIVQRIKYCFELINIYLVPKEKCTW